MTYRLLDTVVLDRDLVQYGLRKGDLGAVHPVTPLRAGTMHFGRAAIAEAVNN